MHLGRTISQIWGALVAAAPVRLWAMIIGAPALLGMACWLVWLVRYGWPLALAAQQLTILGWALWASLAIIGVIVVSLAAVKVKAEGIGGASFEVDGDDDKAPPHG